MKYLFAFFLLCFSLNSFSQRQSQNDTFVDPGHMTCSSVDMTYEFLEAHPEEIPIARAAKQELDEFTRNFVEDADREQVVFIIPVVFHVIHIDGDENISNEQIQSAIDVMNEDYSATNAGVNSVVEEFQDIVANVEFEFRLAKLDPEGNCTNGIVRVFDAGTLEGGENLKSISPSWGRESYLNIWVCSSISSGAAGYAFLPSSVNGSQGAAADGIVILHDYVGRIGTSNTSRSHALVHEIGHWSNLEHTWGSTNNPDEPQNCNDDDGIADTPNTRGWTSCNLNGETCGSLDNVENYMDYSYCYKMFTNGQKNRMRAAHNSSISQRNQLHSSANLIETGVNAPSVICLADFKAITDRTICAGQMVEFEDLSFNGVVDRQWTFTGGTPTSSTESSPEILFETPGTYDVTLIVSNLNGSETATKAGYITVLPDAGNGLPYFEGFDSFTSLVPNDAQWTVGNPDQGPITWELTDAASVSGNKSVYVRGRQNEDYATEYLYSPTYDLTGLSENAVFTFKYAHARRFGSSDDELRVYISKNCGENWSFRESLDIDDLPTVSGNVTGDFVPTSDNDWAEVVIDNISSVFLTEQFRVRFDYISYRGNNIYIDDINIFDPTVVGLEEINFVSSFKLFPNPTTGHAVLDYTLESNDKLTIDVLDITGRKVLDVFQGMQPIGKQRQNIDAAALSPGVYFVRMRSGGEQTLKKLVLQR